MGRKALWITLGAVVVGVGGGCQILAGLVGPDVALAVGGSGGGGASTSSTSSAGGTGGIGGTSVTCSDEVENGSETGKDCGGGVCTPCPDGEGCNIGSDCLSGSCSTSGVCLPPACEDHVKNGDETDVDCGGATCAAKCDFGKKCTNDDDCRSGHCDCADANCADGTCGALTLATGQNIAYGIAVQDTSVFWTDVAAGTVMKGAIGGGPSFALASGQMNPRAIVVDTTSVYWTVDTGIMTTAVTGTPDAGSAVSQLASGAAMDLALRSANLYWTDAASATVNKSPVGGGPPFPVASALDPFGIAADATSVYWTEPSTGTVMKVPLSGGTASLLASGQSSPKAIAVDGVNVYWATFGGVMKAPIDGSSPPGAVATGAPMGIAVDGTYVYWTDATAGTVMKASVDGADVVTLASDQPMPAGIAIDGSSVYWAAGAFIRKVRK